MRDKSSDRRSAVDTGPDRSWVAEQLAAARARQEPEADGEPEPVVVLGEALRDLAAEWGEVLAAAWNGPHGRDVRLAARAGAHAALAAIATWLAAVTLCVTVWLVSAPNTAGLGGPLRVGGQLWLLGHHAALDVPAGRIALAPLGFTALLVLALWQTAVAPIARPAQVAYAAFGSATGYCLVAALVATGAGTGDVRPDTAQAVLFAVLFGALVPTAARWRRIVGFCDPPEWMATAARAGAAACAVLVGGAALTLAGAMVAHLPEPGWPRGIADAAGMFLLTLAVLPNALAWSASYILGPGFAAGTGTGVSLLSTKIGALPTFPILNALPRNGSHIYPYSLAFLALPVAAGVVLALVVLRAGERPPADRARALSTAAVVVALLAGLVATLSGGPLAGGRMATLGPSGWRTAAATFLLLGATAAIVVLTPPLFSVVRGLPRPSVGRMVDAAATLRPRRRVVAEPQAGLEVVLEETRPAELEPEPEVSLAEAAEVTAEEETVEGEAIECEAIECEAAEDETAEGEAVEKEAVEADPKPTDDQAVKEEG